MEQIVRSNNALWYGERRCGSADEAYRLFRDDYHRELGKSVYMRLDRLGQRRERLHSFGFVFEKTQEPKGPECVGEFRCRLLGMLDIGYVRTIGLWDYCDVSDDAFEDWLDWVFSRGNGHLHTDGIRDRVGRTSRRLRTRYR